MAFSVVTNNNAMAALQSLNQTQQSLSTTQSRITTGLKVAGAADNASTFSIAQGMRGDIAGLKSVSQSIALGKSTVGVALSGAEQISNKLNDLKAKVVEAQNVNVDRAKIQQDVDSIIKSIDDIASAAQFNGVNLLKSGGANLSVLTGLNRTSASAETATSTTVSAQDLSAAGANLGINGLAVTAATDSYDFKPTATAFAVVSTAGGGDQISLTSGGVTHIFEFTEAGATPIKAVDTTNQEAHGVVVLATDTTQQKMAKAFDAMRDAGFTVTAADDGSFNVSSAAGLTASTFRDTGGVAHTNITLTANTGVTASLTKVEAAITNANKAVAALGTSSNSLDASAKFTESLTDALTTGVGQLVDADLAAESANLQALPTRQQLGIQALSIANQQSGSILSLFRG